MTHGEYNSSWCINMIDVGKRIKTLRSQKGISARLLAQETNLDPSQISKIEGGTSKPALLKIYKTVIPPLLRGSPLTRPCVHIA